MNYQEAQDYLDNLQMHKIKLGLESMENFLAKVARPDKRLKFVHVAGTNGKGSVSVNIVSILDQAGYRVGLFTSPHLSSVRERFRINDVFITEEEFAHHASKVREALGDDLITYFEFTTALALLWFADSAVDLVVLETGLGGRLDATNIVLPMVSVITNVSMDHEAYLGDDLASISNEKAGIIKSGVPLVTAVANDISHEVVANRCRELGCEMYLYDRDFRAIGHDDGSWVWKGCNRRFLDTEISDLYCGMKGSYQVSNSSLALAVVLLLQEHGFNVNHKDVRKGLASVLWPGRLEHVAIQRNDKIKNTGVTLDYLIDGAHNPAGVASLIETLNEEYSFDKLIVVWGAMEDKDLSLTIPAIAKITSTLILTKPDGERAAEPQSLLDVIPPHHRAKCHLQEDVVAALHLAEEYAGADDLIVVAGSLYLIGEVRRLLVGELVGE